MIQIINADVIAGLKSLPEKSVHCVITSPPYWGVRDYGVEGQIGLEKTPEEYLEKMVQVFREVKRVLRDDGTAWVNMGDNYATGGYEPHDKGAALNGNDCPAGWAASSRGQGAMKIAGVGGLKQKDLVGMPWRLAFALQADGWYLRSDIIWSKPNPMPESITDRPTKSHEYVFLLTKKARYFYEKVFGPCVKVCGSRYLWGLFPLCDPSPHYGKEKIGPCENRPALRAIIPEQISRALCIACEHQ